MSIRIQCCGILLMIVLLYFYVRQKRLSLNTERAFLKTFFVTFSSLAFDILSIVALNYREMFPELFVKFLCKAYLATLVGEAFCGLIYICVDICTTNREYRKMIRKYNIAALTGVLLIFSLPLDYRFAEDGRTVSYTYGASVYATYVFAMSFLVIIFCLMGKEKNRISPARREGVRIWMILWVGASLVQFFVSNFLIVGYMSAIGMMILYLQLENPETNLDRQSGMFNHSALIPYMRQLFEREQVFSVSALMLYDSLNKILNSRRMGAAGMEMLEFLLKTEGAVVFKETENEIFLVFESPEKAEENIHRILERFQSGWGKNRYFYLKHHLIHIPDAGIVENTNDLLDLVHHINQPGRFSANHLVIASKEKAEEMYRKKEIEKLLADAIEQDRVEVFYQPIFSTKLGRFTSAEALVRIRNKDGKLVPPGLFIDVAEQNGTIIKLGAIIFEKVCRMIKAMDFERYGLQYLEINLSVVQCAEERLAENYIGIMEKYNIPPKYINLEITESASLDAKAVLLCNMKKLIAYGVHFSLDDFGTGQSNLNYIIDMPVDIVKFDREMTTAYFKNQKAVYVMENVINMVHGMGLEIVSEGIETEECYQKMRELGISYIQGYYFSKPLPEDEFLQFIREKNLACLAQNEASTQKS